MNQIAKISKYYLWVFLAGYLGLLTYSSFHFHFVNLTDIETICEFDGSSQSNTTADSFNVSTFTCQFNLVYSSPYYLDAEKAETKCEDYKHEIVQFKNNNDHTRKLTRALLKLRAPPDFS